MFQILIPFQWKLCLEIVNKLISFLIVFKSNVAVQFRQCLTAVTNSFADQPSVITLDILYVSAFDCNYTLTLLFLFSFAFRFFKLLSCVCVAQCLKTERKSSGFGLVDIILKRSEHLLYVVKQSRYRSSRIVDFLESSSDSYEIISDLCVKFVVQSAILFNFLQERVSEFKTLVVRKLSCLVCLRR